jgi:putative nucleotidyltransferase with HDIG domain
MVHSARDLAQILFQQLPQRWRHTIGVARRAEELTAVLDGDDPTVLAAAAWLHDIGYAEQLAETGFHPLDGARPLDRLGWPARITALVAHHSGAVFVAHAQRLGSESDAYPREHSALSDALT